MLVPWRVGEVPCSTALDHKDPTVRPRRGSQATHEETSATFQPQLSSQQSSTEYKGSGEIGNLLFPFTQFLLPIVENKKQE